jgi:uncharacterized membrane protein YccC
VEGKNQNTLLYDQPCLPSALEEICRTELKASVNLHWDPEGEGQHCGDRLLFLVEAVYVQFQRLEQVAALEAAPVAWKELHRFSIL